MWSLLAWLEVTSACCHWPLKAVFAGKDYWTFACRLHANRRCATDENKHLVACCSLCRIRSRVFLKLTRVVLQSVAGYGFR